MSISHVDASDGPSDTPIQAVGEGPNFYLDSASFQRIGPASYVEVYIAVQYDELQFVRKDGAFRATYELHLTVENQEGGVLAENQSAYLARAATFDETVSAEKAQVHMLSFDLMPGTYVLRVSAKDQETEQQSILVAPLCVKDLTGETLSLSDIQFSQNIRATDRTTAFVKNGLRVEPNVMRLFSPYIQDVFVYVEAYHLDFHEERDNTPLRARFTVYDESGRPLAEREEQLVKSDTSCSISFKLPARNFGNGQYALQIDITDPATGQSATTSRSFSVLTLPTSAMRPSSETYTR